MTNDNTELESIAMTTDGEIIRDLTTAATEMQFVANADGDERVAVLRVDPAGMKTWNLEEFAARPWRKRGTAQFDDPESFANYVGSQAEPDLGLYANHDTTTITAVFQDHTAAGPGWRDFTAIYRAKLTAEWLAWSSMHKAFTNATELAEFIEEWRHTIAEPSMADLLDLVRHFRATKKVTFRDEIIDRSGDRSLEYVTETEAAGKGELPIPDHLTLILEPIVGVEKVWLTARFRYRLNNGQATFGFVLEQPDKILREAFDESVGYVTSELEWPVWLGRPAGPQITARVGS